MHGHEGVRRPRRGSRLAAASAALLVAWPVATAAQAVPQRGGGLRLPEPPTEEFAARGSRAAPGIALGIPSGFGADWRDASVGFGFQATTRLADRPDGVAALAVGVGDAQDAVGLEVVVASYGTARSCCRGGISFKVHRVLPAAFGIAVGWENGAVWGKFTDALADDTDAGSSVYGVVSKVLPLRWGDDPYRSLTLTLGAGNGRFRAEDDIIAGRETVNVFGGAALRTTRRTSIVADWTGQDLVAGFSFLPFRDHALVVLPGFADLTTEPRFILGAAYGFDYTTIFD
jgi:hypothetical protein